MKITIPIAPRTKKNSMQIIRVRNRQVIIPSKLYKEYEAKCEWYLPPLEEPINYPVNVMCLYYMPTRRRVDLNNLLEATTDVLVKYGIIEDDNYHIVASHDGSRVFYDKENPRTEIIITRLEENEW